MGLLEIEIQPEPFERPYKILDLEVTENEELSLAAKGLHTYLISRPPGWKVWENDLISKSANGRDSVRAKLKELEEAGYIVKEQMRDGGKFSSVKLKVHYTSNRGLKTRQRHRGLKNRQRETRQHNNRTVNNNRTKTLSKDKDGRDLRSRLTEKTFLLRIKPRQPKNNNGLLYDSNKEPNKRIDLSKWLDHHKINKYDDREKEIHRLQTSLFAKQINPATKQIKEVLDYWNKIAFEMRNNGHKLPSHQIKDTKTIYMCQLIITGILHTSTITVEDFKKAIDNYSWILENSPWYNKIYPFPKFFSNRKLFDDCITGDIKENRRYVSQKKKTTKEGLLRIAEDEHRLLHGRKATYDEIQLYKRWIHEGEVTTEDEAKKCAR